MTSEEKIEKTSELVFLDFFLGLPQGAVAPVAQNDVSYAKTCHESFGPPFLKGGRFQGQRPWSPTAVGETLNVRKDASDDKLSARDRHCA